MPKKFKITIQDNTFDLFYDLFKTPQEGIEYALESFPVLYKKALSEISGLFTRAELYMIIDVFEGISLTSKNAGKYILEECFSAMDEDSFNVQWKVDKEKFEQKLRVLTRFQSACLELWANSYWYGAGATSKSIKTDQDLEGHIGSLL